MSSLQTHQITLIKSRLNQIGGLEKYTWKIAEAFCKQGIEVTLLTTQLPTPSFDHPLLKLISFPLQCKLSYQNVLHFDRACHTFLQKHPSSLVFSLDRNRFQTHHRAGNGVHAAYLHCRSQEEGLFKKASFWLNPLHRTILKLEKQAFEHPELQVLFTNSYMVKEEVLRYYKTPENKIEVVHNAVEWHQMQKSFDEWEEAKKRQCLSSHLNPETHHLLFVGNNYRRKGLIPLLEALSLLPYEDFHLTIIGKEKNTPFFQQLASYLQLTNKVSFLGPQTNILPFYQMADTLVIPSLYDPFANVTLEALSMGLFVLSSSHNGGKEILTNENGAIIANLKEKEGFAHLLRQTLQLRKTRPRAKLIRDSIEHLDFSHQLNKIVQKTLSVNQTHIIK